MKNITIFLIMLTQLSFGCFAQNQKILSKQSIQEDLTYLFKTLDKSDYNLYANTPKEIFDKEYNRIMNSIKDSLTMLQVKRLFQSFVALSKDSHCFIDLPIDSYKYYLQNGGTLFPINVYFKNNRVFVLNNFSTVSSIIPGDEILSINRKPMTDVMKGLYEYISGENDYTKNGKIEGLSFPRIFWIVYGERKEYNVGIKTLNGQYVNYKIQPISCIDFERNMSKEKPLPFAAQKRSFRYIGNIACLTPGQFYNVPPKGSGQLKININMLDNSGFLHFLDSCFTIIHNKHTKNLIIDLRGNPGGSATFSNLMVAFFASKPFVGADTFYVRTSEISKNFWKGINDTSKLLVNLKKEIMSRANGSRFEIKGADYLYQPRHDSLKYKGKVYVLINRFCGSQGIEVPAMIQKYGFGKLIGEKTPPLISANARQFKLPNTKITVTFPEASYGDSYMKYGVKPDYPIQDDILTDKDEILDYALSLIKKGSN